MKISQDKRNKLIGVALAAAAMIFAVWYLLISNQTVGLAEVSKNIEEIKDREQKMKMAVKIADKVQAELDNSSREMGVIEQEIANGDVYSWMYNTIKVFKVGYRVEIPQFSAVDQSDCTLVYKFPYKQVKMSLNGSGYFHDIGKFVADFENHYPHIRIQNVELAPGGNTGSAEREKLYFRMDIVALVKTPEKTKP